MSVLDEFKATFSSLENALAVGGAACQGFREGVVDTAVSMADVEAYKAGLDLLQKGNALDKSVALLGMTAIAVDQATDIASLGSKAFVKKALKEGASKVVKEVGDKLLNKVVKEVGSHAAAKETVETTADVIRKGAEAAGETAADARKTWTATSDGKVLPPNTDINVVSTATPDPRNPQWLQVHSSHPHKGDPRAHAHGPQTDSGKRVDVPLDNAMKRVDDGLSSGELRIRQDRSDVGGGPQ